MSRTALASVVIAGCLLPSAARAQDVYHDNVVIILDASGSMREYMRSSPVKKMKAAQTALKEVLTHISETTNVGLFVFSGRGIKTEWVYPLGPRDDAKLMGAIDLPRPEGNTPLGASIKKGADRLLKERAAQMGYGTYRLLVVTDGEASDQSLVDRYTPEVIARGITVDVIGVDMKSTHTLAKIVHSYRKADDPGSLKTAIAEVFAEVSAADGDAAGDEAFALLAPIPSETAQAMLGALTRSGNHPIGTVVRTSQTATPPVPAASPVRSRPAPTPVVSRGTDWTWVVIVLIAIGAFVAKGAAGMKKDS
jgi:uncharacterized protein YegL